MTQMGKNLLEMWETGVLSLGQEDSLENEMAIHSSILAWRIPWTEEPGSRSLVHGVTRSRFTFSQNYSLIHGLQNVPCVSRHESNTNLIVYPHQSSWVTRGLKPSYSERNLFFFFFLRCRISAADLKHSVNHFVNKCAIILNLFHL